MNAERPRFAVMRGSVFAALTLVALLAACEAKMPTSADVDGMDAASAQRAATKLSMFKATDSTVYLVDGVRMLPSQANQIAPEQIASIEVKKSPAGQGTGYVLIHTKAAKGLVEQVDSAARIAIAVSPDSQRLATDRIRIATASGDASPVGLKRKMPDGDTSLTIALRRPFEKMGAKPLLYVDGVKMKADALNTLRPDDIESVEVIKGPSAAAYVNDPEAANGVIIIKTKKAQK